MVIDDDVVLKNVREIFWANGMTCEEGFKSVGYRACNGMIHFTERKLKAIMAKFGVTLEELKEEDALGKIYGEYQLPMNVGILLALCDQTRVEFARNLGVSPGTVTYFLNPDHRPTARMIKKLSKYFNVPANRLLFGYASVEFELERDKKWTGGTKGKAKTRN